MVISQVMQRRSLSSYEKQVISICFDEFSLPKIQPGLKLLYSIDEPPVFVRVLDNQISSKSAYGDLA